MEKLEETSFLDFRIVFYTKPGEKIRILGNIPELGNWDLKNSFELRTDP
jgi:hypothetical protein